MKVWWEGRRIYANGNVVEGKLHEGECIYPCGDKYKGDIFGGKKHGNGCYVWATNNILPETLENDYVVTGWTNSDMYKRLLNK